MSTTTTARARRNAILLMVTAAICWSIAGVFTRHLESAKGFEVTFWRSFFAFVCMALILVVQKRRAAARHVAQMGWPGLVSSLCWAAMFTFFMLALTRTSTANTLVVMSVYPLLAALLAWLLLKEAIAAQTWLAIAVATAGIAWMFGHGFRAGSRDDVIGTLIACAVPIAASINVIVLKMSGKSVDLVPAVLVGAAISALVTVAPALPFQASLRDLAILALLGFVQLGLPCLLMIRAALHLTAPELALLSLLEVLLGPLWAWLGAGEKPPTATLMGGAIVLAALAGNELMGMQRGCSALKTEKRSAG